MELEMMVSAVSQIQRANITCIVTSTEPTILIKGMQVGKRQFGGEDKNRKWGILSDTLYRYMNLSQWCSVTCIIIIC